MPFFLPLLAGAAAATGVHSGIKGLQATKGAKTLVERVQRMERSSVSRLEGARGQANAQLEQLGRLKADIASAELARFVELFGRLREVDLSDFNATISVEDENYLSDIADLSNIAVSLLGSAAAGVGGGVFAGFAAYGAVGAFATASTGTAIGTLSGAAASSATLAWLGGGAIAAGGGGMAVGTVVLGAVVGGPALLLGGVLFDRRALKDLAKVQKYDAEVRAACATRSGLITTFEAVRIETSTICEALTAARKPFGLALDRLEHAIETEGANYRYFTEDTRKVVHLAFLFAQTVKALINVPALSENGAMLDDYRAAVRDLNDLINNS